MRREGDPEQALSRCRWGNTRGMGHFRWGETGVALVGRKPCRDAMPSFKPSDRPGGLPTMKDLKAAEAVRTFSAVIERCADTGLLVGYVPGFPGDCQQR